MLARIVEKNMDGCEHGIVRRDRLARRPADGAAHSGDCHGALWAFAAGGGASPRHGPEDAARLGEASQRFQLAQPVGMAGGGYSRQRRRLGGARGPAPAFARAA